MRITGFVLALLLVLLLTLGARAVEYAVGQPIALSVRSSATTILPGATVRLSISASDIDYEVGANNIIRRTITDPCRITVSASAGTFQQTSVANNPLDVTWYSPITPGNYAIFVTATDSGQFAPDQPARALIEVIVTKNGNDVIPPAVRVAVNPQTLCIDNRTTATVYAQLLGNDIANKTISFFATGGALSTNRAVTDNNGAASARLTVSRQDLGTLQVAASYGNTTSTTTMQVTTTQPILDNPGIPDVQLPGTNSQGVLIDVNPAALPADGASTAVVAVRITNARGIGIPQQPVIFRTTMGQINPLSITDLLGFARVQLVAAAAPGTGIITAEAGALRGYALITYTQQPQQAQQGAPRVFLTLDPTTLLADGASIARIEALVLDTQGRALPDTPVSFSTTLGAVKTATVNTGADGKASTTLTAADRPGNAVVSARVGQITAASQVTFQAPPTTGPGLEIKIWNGQQSGFVAENWLQRQMQIETGKQSTFVQTLAIFDENGKIKQEYSLPKTAQLITDENGVARGYATEEDKSAKLILLKADGSITRTQSVDLPLGLHLVDVRYAEPAGNLLVTLANPDGTKPEVHFYSAIGPEVLTLKDGLEKLPLLDLGGDGFLAMSLPGGTVRLYSPTGIMISESRRTDGLPATRICVGPNGDWIAVASALSGQTDKAPRVSVFPRQGTQAPAVYDYEAVRMTVAGPNTLMLSTPDRTVCINLVGKRTEWSLTGGYERYLTVKKYGIIAGQRDVTTRALLSRILVVKLDTGQIAATQDFADLRAVLGVLPPDDKDQPGVIAMTYVLRFPLPKEKE